MTPLDHDWWVGLDSWVLQDGNYTDFVVGERRQFALEFAYRREARLQRLASPGSPSCRHTGPGTTYDVVGQLIRTPAEPQRDAFVLDFGLRAYSHWMVLDDAEPLAAGDWVGGQIHLGVDPFFYIDELAALPDMPALIYTWTVVEIELDPARVRDSEPPSWRGIERTRVWDEEGCYRLRCRRDHAAATRLMRPTGPLGSPHGPLGTAP